jgi:O-antigen/teichoic acid export membrane protein
VALYAAAEFVTRVIANPRYVFDHVIAPVLAEALHAGDRARVRYNLALVTRWVVTAASPIAATVIVLRAEILGLYGAPFVASSPTLVVLALANLVSGALGLTPYVIAMGGRSRLMLLNNLGAAALNIALGVLLVPRVGVIGAAVAVLASATAFQVALTLETWALERVHPFAMPLVKPLVAAFAALVVEALVHRYVAAPAVRVTAVIAAGAVTYGALLVALGLEPEERDVLRRARERLRPSRR